MSIGFSIMIKRADECNQTENAITVALAFSSICGQLNSNWKDFFSHKTPLINTNATTMQVKHQLKENKPKVYRE